MDANYYFLFLFYRDNSNPLNRKKVSNVLYLLYCFKTSSFYSLLGGAFNLSDKEIEPESLCIYNFEMFSKILFNAI